MPIHELARRLGLTIESQTMAMASLSKGSVIVGVFADPAGQAYVNGTPVGPRGGFGRVDGVLCVPAALEPALRAAIDAVTASRPPPNRTKHRVVIDAGHGGKDPGAIGVTGVQEKSITLAVAARVARRLASEGFDVSMTRSTDAFVELDERAAMSNRAGAELFVSIHADHAPDPSLSGSTVYTCRDAPPGTVALAQGMADALRQASIPCRGTRQADFRVLVGTACPALLIEMGYLSHSGEARNLTSPAYQQRLADAMAEGIRDHFAK
jgi:N-acetylmuramoyl-L-alanine amidase